MTMTTRELISNKSLLLIMISALITLTSSLKAQGFSYDVKCIENTMAINDFDTLYSHQCILHLNDTLNADSIKVVIGNSLLSNNVLDYTFVFDQSTFLPANLAYYRKGSEITLELGNYLKADFYYGVSIVDTLGIESNVVQWNNKTP